MQTIVLPTAYLPSLAYIICIVRNQSVIIDMHEHYMKQSCRNRCYIYSANGALPLIIPVHKSAGNHTPVRDIEISYLQRWQTNHWRAIESAYQSSPFFLYYKDDLRPFYQRNDLHLASFNRDLLALAGKLLTIDLQPCFSEEYTVPDGCHTDLRNERSFSSPHATSFQPYPQVFQHKYGFISNLSILDLLFNLGPESKGYIERQIF
jgi:hypothetical protein